MSARVRRGHLLSDEERTSSRLVLRGVSGKNEKLLSAAETGPLSNSSLIEAGVERSDISTAPAPDYDLEVTEGAAATCPASQPSIARLRVTPQW